MTGDYHHEMEMVVALKSGGYNIPAAEALDHIYGYGVGFDMTRRDIQGSGLPWEVAKSFDQSCPCGAISTVESVGHISSGNLTHRVALELVAEIGFAHIGLLASKLGRKASTNLGAIQCSTAH
jgi:2-keto-4-pentenoate hydratase/2-oxohepta-3-ene-1,7-dioic acid hydratase in catechol pathway